MVGDLNFPTLGRLASAVPTVRRLGEHCNEEELAPFWQQFLIDFVDLLMVLDHHNYLSRIQEAEIDHRGSRPSNNDH